MNKDKMETSRLILRQLSESDLDAYYDLETDPDVKHYIGGPLQRSKEALRYTITQSKQSDFSLLAVIQKSTNHFIGRCGVIKNESIKEYEIHIVLVKKFWGQGFASELTEMLLSIAFSLMDLKRVVAILDPQNGASEQIVNNFGMKFLRTLSLSSDNYQNGHKVYYIDCPDKDKA